MRIEDLNWMEMEKYLQHEDRLMLVLGSCEQHAYLSLLTDIKVPLALADAASQASGVLVAPPLNFGISPYFLAYPGTFSLRVGTLIAVVEDIVRSAYDHGFRRLLILNGHGGNSPARSHLQQINNDMPGLRMDWYDWWQSHSVETIAQKYGIKPAHANWLESFSFTRVGDLPASSKVPPNVPGSILDAKTARKVFGDGSFGGPYRVEDHIMQELFASALDDILQLLRFD